PYLYSENPYQNLHFSNFQDCSSSFQNLLLRPRYSSTTSSPNCFQKIWRRKVCQHFFFKQSTNFFGWSQPLSSCATAVLSDRVPAFWIGVGIGLSALFTWVASSLKKYAMHQAFKTMMGQMNTQNNQFGNATFPSGSPFPFPTPLSQGPVTSPSPPQRRATVDVPATKVEAAPTTDPATNGKSETETTEPKKYAFLDVSPEESMQKNAIEDVVEISSSDNAQIGLKVSDNGAASKQDASAFGGYQSSGIAGPVLSVDALEKMMEDPTVQKMVYPYLPEEMRNPETFKWMLQNPQYRQQLQDMLNNMGGSSEWDNRMMDSLKNFDLNSPEVKQQFDQIGLTPEEVISKIMANPEVAMAFQNPRVQEAIMDCSQNPLSIAKFQNDKEVMDVFNKISELFPGVTG
ncbi:protein TIC 40, chloroplastic-like, partial [Hibiscus syriacus]